MRQKLINQGKTNSYFIYAIGEIALIVIGILIALAIDNNNEHKITRGTEQVYLVGLKKEFEISKIKLQNLIKVNNDNYKGAKEIVTYIDNKDSSLSEIKFSALVYNSFAYSVSFYPNNSLLNEMINSGSLKDVSNQELRTHLIDWNSRLINITHQEKDLESQREKVIDLLRKNENSIRTIFDLTDITSNELDLSKKEQHSSNLNILKSREFENNMLIFILSSKLIEKEHYLPLLEELDFIINLINKEIKK